MGNKISLQKRCNGIAMVILLVFGLNYSLKAQQYFQKSFAYNTNIDHGNSLIRTYENTTYFTAITYDSTQFSNLIVAKTDSLLNIQWSKLFQKDSISFYDSEIVNLPDSSLIVIVKANDLLGVSFAFIFKLNSFGDTLWTSEIKKSGYDILLNKLNVNGDTLIMLGTIASSSNIDQAKGLVISINLNDGEIIFSTEYSLGSFLNTRFEKGIHTIINNIRAYFIFGFALIDSGTVNNECFILKMNDDLSISSTLLLADSCGPPYSDIITTENNDKILCKFTKTEDFIGWPYNCFLEFDNQLNVKWFNKYIGGAGYAPFRFPKYIESSNNIITSLGSRIYLLDSIGNVLQVTKSYDNPSNPSEFAQLNSLDISNNKLSWFGNRITGSAMTSGDILCITTDIHGVGCVNLSAPALQPYPLTLLTSYDTSMTANNILLDKMGGFTINPIILTESSICNVSVELQKVNFENIIPFAEPNPSSGTFHLSGLSPSNNYIYYLYNNIGSIIENGILNEEFKIDFSKESVGFYILQLIDQNNKSWKIKLLKL